MLLQALLGVRTTESIVQICVDRWQKLKNLPKTGGKFSLRSETEQQCQEHLKDEVFLAWVKKNATSETKEGAPTPMPGYVSTSAG